MPPDRTLSLDAPALAVARATLARIAPRLRPLRIRGELPPLDRAVAIVGTRAADADALHLVEELAANLGRAGIVVVSGGAIGIDAAAHRGALRAGAPTIAVLPSGFEPPFPLEHAELFTQIVQQGGALLSEHPDGTAPKRGLFLARNRIVAAMSRVVVVGQAPVRSGALSTARLATSLEIPVMAVPYAPWDPRGAGCLTLLRQGAAICTSVEDVLFVPALGAGSRQLSIRLDSDKTRDFGDSGGMNGQILEEISARPLHPDEIAHRLGLSAQQVQRALLALVVRRVAEPRPGGRFARVR